MHFLEDILFPGELGALVADALFMRMMVVLSEDGLADARLDVSPPQGGRTFSVMHSCDTQTRSRSNLNRAFGFRQ